MTIVDGLDVAVALSSVAFVAVVAVKAARGPVAWLAWPPLVLPALATVAGGFYIARAVLGPAGMSSAIAGASWLVLAAALAGTRWWMHRRMRRRVAAITQYHPSRQGRS